MGVWQDGTGVYCIRNRVNGKVYVGSSARSLFRRWKGHKRALRDDRHYNEYLQRAWNKYGESNFYLVVLERCPPARCVEREQFWIDRLRAADPGHGYNRSPTAGSNLGCRHTRLTKTRLSRLARERELTPQGRAARKRSTEGNLGRKNTEEAKARMSAGRKGGGRGARNPRSRFSESDIIEIKGLLEAGELRQWEIAEIFGTTQGFVANVKAGRIWGWLTGHVHHSPRKRG